MAYVFRIHEAKKAVDPAPFSAANMSGWTQTGHIAGNLLGNITLGASSNKMGTSIPSIFARIFLFEGAFQALKGRPIIVLQGVNSDTRLVSECLDLIEFLFQHGGDKHLVVRRWNATDQIKGLHNSAFKEHKELAKVLEDEIRLYPNLGEIFLFYWDAVTPQLGRRKILIGGTSPYTMVFTSPNWRTAMAANSLSFNRLNGKAMFSDASIESLKDRDSSFKDMIYSLHMAFNTQLQNLAPNFDSYIAQMMDNDSPGIAVGGMAGNPAAFLAKYTNIKDSNGADVACPVIPLSYEKVVPQASGYEIVATSVRYKTYTANDGTHIVLDAPLALNENGLGAGVNYIGTYRWDAAKCKINEAAVRTAEMHNRILPGQTGTKYPFLIWSDFLEDKIIKLPYAQDADNFITAGGGDAKYVLPLKRNFFKYFNIEDISRKIDGTDRKIVEMSFGDNSVTVTINVPVRDALHKSIPFIRKYEGDNIIGNTPFLLGFFPFYKVAGNDVLNRYSVMKCGGGVSLRFYKVGLIDSPIEVTLRERTAEGKILSQTEYYSVKSSFDMVEVCSGNTHGIILPKMFTAAPAGNHYNFAVDFGTSNTYIAHTTNGQNSPATFEIDAHDRQTVFLTSQSDMGQRLNTMRSPFAREFAPVALGQGADMAYPCRTAVCETAAFENVVPELFGTISIGFNMMNEKTKPSQFVYKTGLKWLLERHPGDTNHTNRVKYYFLQTLWMLKNESFLNGGDDNFDVYITFPETMKAPTKMALMNLWNWAKTELCLGCAFHSGTDYSESVAPYNCMASRIGGSSYLNIDIGGGTNDLLFVLKDGGGQITDARYFSAMFAGDDLWGDGIVISTAHHGGNGFVDFLVGNPGDGNVQGTGIRGGGGAYPREKVDILEALLNGVSTSSADVMGYLFKYDDVFQTSGKIRGNTNLYSIVFIHYAAIMYNVSRLIKNLNIDIPERMSFTGMGSKYINLISSDRSVLKALTKLLLEKYTGKKTLPAFDIIDTGSLNVDVKEVTAKGVLEGLTLQAGFKIPAGHLQPAKDLGFDTDKTLTYKDLAKNEVRDASLKEFMRFVGLFKDNDFRNFLFNNFGFSIPDALLDDLKTLGEQSFKTMSASVPKEFSGLNVQETLFFWPLKDTLIELSRRYK